MKIHKQNDEMTLWHGDCIEVMRALPDESVDSIVTDPPYGLEFMGKGWDGADGFRRSLNAADTGRDNAFGRTSRTSPEYRAGALFGEWCEAWAIEALRVLKPGGHMLAFGGTRTWHRLAVAVEDAGFEIRDSIAWLYGSGFPKSMDVSKAIDKAAGAEREVIGKSKRHGGGIVGAGSSYEVNPEVPDITAPATDAAREWEGWGTALKPAFEPIVVGRKPLVGTVAANVLKYGTGALNIAASRVGGPFKSGWSDTPGKKSRGGIMNVTDERREPVADNPDGRWPTNVLLDESQAAALDAQSGISESRVGKPRGADSGDGWGMTKTGAEYADIGGASRFFPTFRYEAKAPTSERPSVDGVQHPTVKPLELMRWLVRLVTPVGGLVLEPFAGSGTTIEAALLEGFRCTAIEREESYLPLIEKRINKPLEVGFDFGDWNGAA